MIWKDISAVQSCDLRPFGLRGHSYRYRKISKLFDILSKKAISISKISNCQNIENIDIENIEMVVISKYRNIDAQYRYRKCLKWGYKLSRATQCFALERGMSWSSGSSLQPCTLVASTNECSWRFWRDEWIVPPVGRGSAVPTARVPSLLRFSFVIVTEICSA